jgi:hypothetical protein
VPWLHQSCVGVGQALLGRRGQGFAGKVPRLAGGYRGFMNDGSVSEYDIQWSSLDNEQSKIAALGKSLH